MNLKKRWEEGAHHRVLFYVQQQGRKEGNVLFNEALNTFDLRLYAIRHMVKDHSDSERGNLLPPLHGLLFPISSKHSFICIIPQTGYTYHSLCYTSRGALAGMRNTAARCLYQYFEQKMIIHPVANHISRFPVYWMVVTSCGLCSVYEL